MFAESDLTEDTFLGGRLRIWQPRRGYRAGVDPVLLAAAVAARPGQSVLELGCGAGVASLCLAVRVDGLDLAGIELQPAYAALARRNADVNGIALAVHEGDIRVMPPALRARQFDHVIANPPYFRSGNRRPAADVGRETALAGPAGPDEWVAAASRRLKPGGFLALIQHISRLPEVLTACQAHLGSLHAFPVVSRAGHAPQRVILRARKGGRGDFRLAAPIVMHEGARHEADGESYTAHLRAVLREGAALLSGND